MSCVRKIEDSGSQPTPPVAEVLEDVTKVMVMSLIQRVDCFVVHQQLVQHQTYAMGEAAFGLLAVVDGPRRKNT